MPYSNQRVNCTRIRPVSRMSCTRMTWTDTSSSQNGSRTGQFAFVLLHGVVDPVRTSWAQMLVLPGIPAPASTILILSGCTGPHCLVAQQVGLVAHQKLLICMSADNSSNSMLTSYAADATTSHRLYPVISLQHQRQVCVFSRQQYPHTASAAARSS